MLLHLSTLLTRMHSLEAYFLHTFLYICFGLCSSSSPSPMLSIIGDQAYVVSAARVWNSLPWHVMSAPSLHVFHSCLKMHIFSCRFPRRYSSCYVSEITLSVFCYFLLQLSSSASDTDLTQGTPDWHRCCIRVCVLTPTQQRFTRIFICPMH